MIFLSDLNKEEIQDLPINEIEDDILIDFYCNLIKKNEIEFIKDIEPFNIQDEDIDDSNDKNLYKEIDCKKLGKILKGLLIEGKENSEKIKVFKKKRIVFQRLWPHFVRNAIRLLRNKDKRDKGVLKVDFGVKSLTDYFKEFSNFEEILYGIDEYYRDHSLHVFRVYLLGEYLIRKYLNGYKSIKILNSPEGISEVDIKEKEAIWCIIALCHDLGYPLQKLDELNKKLVKILEYFGTSNFNPLRYGLPLEGIILDKFILKIISSRITKELKIHLQSKFYAKYSNAYEKLNHGVMSCILLMKNLVYFKETDYEFIFEEGFNSSNETAENENSYKEDARQFIIRREILRSIASHDNEDIYHIFMNNFPFLLIICDELQEWSRPSSTRRLLYSLDERNKEIIQILNFNENVIEILITHNFSENELQDYSIKKFRRFIRLLRSAFHSYKRTFDFKLIIANRENIKFIFEYKKAFDNYDKLSPEDKEVYKYERPIVHKILKDDSIDSSFTLNNVIEYL